MVISESCKNLYWLEVYSMVSRLSNKLVAQETAALHLLPTENRTTLCAPVRVSGAAERKH